VAWIHGIVRLRVKLSHIYTLKTVSPHADDLLSLAENEESGEWPTGPTTNNTSKPSFD